MSNPDLHSHDIHAAQRLAVFAATEAVDEKAATIADQLSLPLFFPAQASFAERFDLLIWVDHKGVGLRPPGRKAPNPVRIDFVSGSLGLRGKRSGHSKELVANAVGARHGHQPTVLDVTAGLGRDAFVLASVGCQVDMLERNPVVSLLLRDALQRADINHEVAKVITRMRLIETEAVTFMANVLPPSLRPDVVYLDPMFPRRVKSASVKKEMRILQQLLGEDMDAEQLFEQSLKVALKRVVVKRPRIAPLISELKPHHVVEGKASRFDIYHVKAIT